MKEIPLDLIPSEEGITSKLWKMMRNPSAIQDALKKAKYKREVQIWFTDTSIKRASGWVKDEIALSGDYNITIAYKQDGTVEERTYVEENLHLLQCLLNPMYLQEAELKERVKKELEPFGIDKLPMALVSMYTSSFLQNVDSTILSFAERVGFNGLKDHFINKKELLRRLFTRSIKSPGFHISDRNIIDLSRIAKNWGFDLFADTDIFAFQELHQLLKDQTTRLRALDDNATDEEFETASEIDAEKRRNAQKRVESVLENISIKINTLSDDQITVLFQNFGLQPLLTLENYTIARDWLFNSDTDQMRQCIANYIQTADSVRLERIHYMLRPGAYSGYKISFEEWMNAKEDVLRIHQCLERLLDYKKVHLPNLFVQLIDEEVSQLWIEGETEHAFITHPMFWDVAESSSYRTNPEYIKLNVHAIYTALEKGEIKIPKILSNATQTKGDDFSLLPYEIIKNPESNAAVLIEHIQHEKRARTMSTFDTWHIFASKVKAYMEAGIDILENNPNIPTFKYIIDRLIGISSLWQEYVSIHTLNSFTVELVAKSIKMYLLKRKEPLGDIYAGDYTFLLTSEKPQVYERQIKRGESIWNDLIDTIIDTLQKSENDGKLILQLIQAKDVATVSEIVGYKL